jgi:hypothetical protein
MQTNDFKSYVTKQLQRRFSQYGGRIRTTGETVRTVAAQLRGDPTTAPAADFADRGADFIDRIGAYVEETPVDRMIADAEALSRRPPWVLASAGIAVGILTSRLLKSTAARRAA